MRAVTTKISRQQNSAYGAWSLVLRQLRALPCTFRTPQPRQEVPGRRLAQPITVMQARISYSGPAPPT